MRQITDSDLEYLNTAESGPLDFVGWGQWHLRLNFEYVSVELKHKFTVEVGGQAKQVAPPYSGELPLGDLFDRHIESFTLETGNYFVISLSGNARICFTVQPDRPYEQCVITVHRRAPNDNLDWIVI